MPLPQTDFAVRFAHQAHQTPDAPAVEFEGRSLTYAELAARAHRCAGTLTARGVGVGTIVGVAARPGLDLVVSILAVIKSGAAWLPLDPAYPTERLRYMVEDSGVGLVLAEPGDAAAFDDLVEVLAPDRDPLAASGPRRPAEYPDPGPSDLAYVIYTSGSTGRPKGVMLTRAGLANLVAAQLDIFGAGPGARVLQFAPTSFDASVFEVAMALCAGATLVMAARADIGPGPGLADFLRDHRITHVTLPPSVLATVPATALPDLGVLVCAGEALPAPLVEQWAPGRRMFNAYGPTETTVWATLAEVSAGACTPSIGHPIPGCHAVVVDSRLAPVPDGVAGELAVGGVGVARGYLGRPALTAARFVPDGRTGERVYLTGDHVVRQPDGSLAFRGRVDHQVKLRGFRIELEEVTAQLRMHDRVSDAVVVVRDDGAGDQLVGYVSGTAEPGELSAYLREHLPAHLLPAAVVVLEQLPLSPSGKIDRAALPAPTLADEAAYVAPGTPTERALANILSTLLGRRQVSVHDDFFALGGHSLLAGRYAARVRSELGHELSLRALYESRTVAATAARLDAARPGGPSAPTPPPIRRRNRQPNEPVPLSFPQERIWFLDQLAGGNRAYNAQATIRLTGALELDALRRTLSEIVRRHEAFRSSFALVKDTPMQVVHPPREVVLPLVDLTTLAADDREAAAEERVRQAVQGRFDLGDPPLVRWLLLRLSEHEHLLVHIEHHLVHDGWSYARFLHELQALYPAFLSGQPSPLDPPAVQYADFVLWQREWMQGDVLAAYVEHWRQELDGAPATLDLPTDRPRPVNQRFDGAALRFDLPPQLCRQLRAYSKARGVTLYTSMLAGFAALLARRSGQHDIVIGTGVANRRMSEIEHMVGMVVNTLPLRIRLDEAATFDELARQVHLTTGRAHEWQDVPLDRVVTALQLQHDPSRNPLFQAMFSFHDSRVPSLEFGGLRGVVQERHNNTAKTDLNIVVIPRAEQRTGQAVGDDDAPITLIWEYATDLFDESTMQAMRTEYQTLLAWAVAEPERDLEALALVPPAESERLLALMTGPATPFPADCGIADLFAEQVARAPDAVAVIEADRYLTYAELDDRARRLASVLRAAGVGPETPVGVMFERGLDLLSVLLGVVLAGGAYVPLDPAYPPDRLTWMLKDAAAPVVVTRAALRERLTGAPVLLIALDEQDDALATADPSERWCTGGGRNLAYVMFTSGSAGRAKGVQVEHRSIARLVKSSDYLEFGPSKRFAQVADASFDALTFELWGALLNGGSVCVIPPDAVLTPGELGRQLRANEVTSMFLTSALFTEVMAEHPDSFDTVTDLLIGGDALNVSRVRKLLDRGAGVRPARVVNGYGPTETTTFAVCHLIEQVPEDATSIPIGRPISNTTGYVLDHRLRPVPAGVVGELYIGGPGVARGYAARPGLTADRFCPDPFVAGGARMYRTGDRVRLLPDATIEYLGRVDNQVKIRGYRVDPAEVESTMLEHPDLVQAAVIVRGADVHKRLAAYFVPAPNRPAVSASQLRAFLADRLPPYLLPSSLVELAQMPVTTSGKLDRGALPDPAYVEPADTPFVEPRDSVEAAVAALVCELVGLDRVGVHDDFYSVGGHSLLAMRLVARVNDQWSCDVALRDFLHVPTVARLASAVTATRGQGRAPIAVRAPSEDELLLQRLDELTDEEVEALLYETTHGEAES